MVTSPTLLRDLRQELMDGPDISLQETRRALTDLDRVNRWLFGHSASCRALLPRIAEGPRNQKLIDLGTGSGTVSSRLQQIASRRGIQLEVIGVDRKLGHLLFGRQLGHRHACVVADAEALPFRDDAADWTFSNLFFHHFSSRGNLQIMNEMRRVSQRGSLIVDLRRALAARVLIRLILPLLRIGPIASHDGRLSTDQAWRIKDLETLIRDLPVLELRRRFPFRFSLFLASRSVATSARAQ